MIESLIAQLASWIVAVIQFSGYGGIFLLMALESANIPVPSEVIMPFAGFVAAQGALGFWPVVIAGALGNLFGSIVSYLLAGWVVKNRHRIWLVHLFVSDSFLKKAEDWFHRYGAVSVFFSRMLPVVRTFISLPAGAGKMRFGKFCSYTLLGSVLWSWLLAYCGWYLGIKWDQVGGYLRKFDVAIVVLLGAGALYWLIKHVGGIIKERKSRTHGQKTSNL